MELGIDKKQIEGAKQFFMGLSKDRVMLRFVICLTILLIGWLTVLDPQAIGLAAARNNLVNARKQDLRATELVFYTHQLEAYEPRLFPDADPLTLQDYVLEKVEASGASVRGMANKKTGAIGVFKVSQLELTATGTYSQLVDLVDRLERGNKIVRLEKCRLLNAKTHIVLECSVKGLVKSGRRRSTARGEAEETEAAAGETREAIGGDAGSDAGSDAENVAGDETGSETGDETGDETGGETGGETGSETGGETGSESGSETGGETGSESGNESGNETGDETGGESGNETDDQAGRESGDPTGDPLEGMPP